MDTKATINTIWTIGHSTRTLLELVAMLHSFQIELVADIEAFPARGIILSSIKKLLKFCCLKII